MELLLRAEATFDASHVDSEVVRCQRTHGHRWTVRVEKLLTTDPADLTADLWSVLSEWHDRDLNEMLHVDRISAFQIAALVMERLLLRHPTIERVECSDGRMTGIARRQVKT